MGPNNMSGVMAFKCPMPQPAVLSIEGVWCYLRFGRSLALHDRALPLHMLAQNDQLRWNRLENLLREGSKSSDFDASQLWLLANWLLSPNAEGIRHKLAVELARMLDATAAAQARERIAERWCQVSWALQDANDQSFSSISSVGTAGWRIA